MAAGWLNSSRRDEAVSPSDHAILSLTRVLADLMCNTRYEMDVNARPDMSMADREVYGIPQLWRVRTALGARATFRLTAPVTKSERGLSRWSFEHVEHDSPNALWPEYSGSKNGLRGEQVTNRYLHGIQTSTTCRRRVQ